MIKFQASTVDEMKDLSEFITEVMKLEVDKHNLLVYNDLNGICIESSMCFSGTKQYFALSDITYYDVITKDSTCVASIAGYRGKRFVTYIWNYSDVRQNEFSFKAANTVRPNATK